MPDTHAMRGIPATALILALAGLLPFLWGAAMAVAPDPGALPLLRDMPAALRDEHVLVRYGTVILCFMSGVLWGFAARAEGHRARFAYIASVLPALWAFFLTNRSHHMDLIVLIIGFLALLALEWVFWRVRLVPRWWLRLRLPLTAVVVVCLALGISG